MPHGATAQGACVKIVCPQCGFAREVPEDKLPQGHVIARCPKCACRFRFSVHAGSGEILPPRGWQRMDGQKEAAEEEDLRAMASDAYEREARRFQNEQTAAMEASWREAARNPWAQAPVPDGWLAAFYQTVIRVMFQAQAFFGNLSPKAQMPRPLSFFLVICIFQTLVDSAWAHVLYSFLAADVQQDPQLAKLLEMLAPSGSLLFTLLLRTGSFILQIYVFSLLMFLAYRIVAKDRATFALVFQVLAYSAAPWILCLIPAIGAIAGTIWGIGCAAIGCKAAMRLNWAQTFAGFLPVILVLAPIVPQLLAILGK